MESSKLAQLPSIRKSSWGAGIEAPLVIYGDYRLLEVAMLNRVISFSPTGKGIFK